VSEPQRDGMVNRNLAPKVFFFFFGFFMVDLCCLETVDAPPVA
jgi:hypothetical protein